MWCVVGLNALVSVVQENIAHWNVVELRDRLHQVIVALVTAISERLYSFLRLYFHLDRIHVEIVVFFILAGTFLDFLLNCTLLLKQRSRRMFISEENVTGQIDIARLNSRRRCTRTARWRLHNFPLLLNCLFFRLWNASVNNG